LNVILMSVVNDECHTLYYYDECRYAQRPSCLLSVMLAQCHSCWVPFLLSVVFINVTLFIANAECRYAEWRHDECLYAEDPPGTSSCWVSYFCYDDNRYAERRRAESRLSQVSNFYSYGDSYYAQCRYAECHGCMLTTPRLN